VSDATHQGTNFRRQVAAHLVPGAPDQPSGQG
jgi:hypothetical protein